MDIKCPKCGEPWDMDCIHDEISDRHPDEPWRIGGKHNQALYEQNYYGVVLGEFRTNGCSALGSRCNPNTTAHPAIGELMDLMGDDVDGAAALMEDFGL